MAIFHLTTKLVCRSKGQSAVAKASYNARAKLDNEHTGARHDYSRKKGLMFSGMFAPKDAPAWAQDRQAFWSEVERRETRINSRLAREIEMALPHELTDQQREWLVKDFVREQFMRRGLVADVVIHAPDRDGDARNYHAHILLPTRYITPDGFGAKARDQNSKEQLAQWREKWAHLANRHLERHGHAARIDHRTLVAQGVDREPTLHLGPHVAAMHAKGIPTDRGDQARTIAARNRTRDDLKSADADARHTLAQLQAAFQKVDTIIHHQEPQKTPPPQAPAPDASVAAFVKRQEQEKSAREAERLDAQRAQAPQPTLGKAVTDAGKAADKGIMVASNIAGRSASKLADAASNFLDLFAGQPPPRKISSSDMLKSPEARKAYSAQQRAMQSAAQQRDDALDRIAEQLKKGPQIEHAALGALSYSDLQHIKNEGDGGLRNLVRQREEELQRHYSFGNLGRRRDM